MNPNDSQHELLLRHLDGRVTPEERLSVAALLRSSRQLADESIFS